MIDIFGGSKVLERDYVPATAPLIDGVEVLNTLCPVSKKTGLRENPLSLITKLVNDPAKAHLLDQFIQEMPTDNSMSKLTDEERVDMLMMRLDSGTPAESDAFREKLMDIVSLMPNSNPVKQQAQDSKIEFDGSDKEIVDKV